MSGISKIYLLFPISVASLKLDHGVNYFTSLFSFACSTSLFWQLLLKISSLHMLSLRYWFWGYPGLNLFKSPTYTLRTSSSNLIDLRFLQLFLPVVKSWQGPESYLFYQHTLSSLLSKHTQNVTNSHHFLCHCPCLKHHHFSNWFCRALLTASVLHYTLTCYSKHNSQTGNFKTCHR